MWQKLTIGPSGAVIAIGSEVLREGWVETEVESQVKADMME